MPTEDILPGSPGGTYGRGVDPAQFDGHEHGVETGRFIDLGCPQPACQWRSESAALGCARCFQLAASEYASHLFANHSWDVFSALQRIAQ